MENINNIKVTNIPEPAPGTLNLNNLYALSIGQVIGAGVITLIGPAIALTGYSAWFAYGLAVILGFIAILPIVFVTGTLRFTGGYYSLIAGVTSPRVAGMYAASQLTNMLSLSLFGVALGLYINSVFPSIDRTLAGIVMLTFFYIINLFGVDIMAKVQTFLTWFLIFSLIAFIIIGVMNIRNPIFDRSDPQWMPNGYEGLLSAIFLYVYSTRGYSMTMNYGHAAKNATRDIPLAILLSMPTIMILYVGTSIVGAGVLPLSIVSGQPLTYVAQELLKGPLFPLFIVGGPIMALLTTMNSTMPAQCYPLYRSVQDGWFPKSFGKLNKRGVPWKIFTVNYILGLIPLLLGFNVNTITNNIMLLGAVQSVLYAYTYWQLPNKFPEAWERSRYHIPTWLYKFIVILSTLTVFAILFRSFKALTIEIALFSLIAILLCILYGYWRGKTADINIEVSVWDASGRQE